MPLTAECDRCGASYQVAPAHAKKRRFCTPACREAFKVEQVTPCAQCGRAFHLPPSRVAKGARFCSMKCRTDWGRAHTFERFWKFVDKTSTPDGCWPWTGHCKPDTGYGVFSIGTAENRSAYLYAHRVAYALDSGEISVAIEPGQVDELPDVRHFVCDNPPCCRPDHLLPGTHKDNMNDRDGKDRVLHGESHTSAKLTGEQVVAIRSLHAAGALSDRAIGRSFGVAPQTIWDITHGRTWKRT